MRNLSTHVLAFALGITALAAEAAPVAFDFTAVDFNTGATATGSMGYDTTGPIVASSPIGTRFDTGFIDFTIVGDAFAGTYSLTSPATDVTDSVLQMNAGPSAGTLFVLRSSTPVFPGISSLPETLDLADFDAQRYLNVLATDIGLPLSPSRIEYTITSLTQTLFVPPVQPENPSTVPLPAAMPLLASVLAALGGLGLLRRRRAA